MWPRRSALMAGVVEAEVRAKLEAALTPTHLEVINESAGHNVPAGSETHFKVVVVSQCFAGVWSGLSNTTQVA